MSTGSVCPAGQECADINGGTCKAGCTCFCEKKPAPPVCGTRQGLVCPKGLQCVDDADDWCDPARGEFLCAGTCQKPPTCGGSSKATCHRNQRCVNKYGDDCAGALRPEECTGTCRRVCGASIKAPCPGGKSCVHFPGSKSGLGICRKRPYPTGAMCGGLTEKACPAGQRCVDRPADQCDPELGGADCPGMCVPRRHGPTTTSTFRMLSSTTCNLTTTVTSTISNTTPSTLSTKLCYTVCADYVNDCGVKYGG